jgi:SAM-dependent methyltransferase
VGRFSTSIQLPITCRILVKQKVTNSTFILHTFVRLMQNDSFKNYYNYLLKNWNKRVATHIIKHEKLGEQKYQLQTTGCVGLQQMKLSGMDTEHANFYMPAPYDMLETFFEKVDLKKYKHFLDIGCGKGRVICVAAHYGVSKITGVDISKVFLQDAEENINTLKKKFPKVKAAVVQANAFYYPIPTTVDCIFLFNPFNEIIMSGVIENIEISLKKKPRKITIIYFNPVDKHLFWENDYKEVFHLKKFWYLEGVILEKG